MRNVHSPRQILYWWPTYADLSIPEYNEREENGEPQSPFLELLRLPVPLPNLVVVFVEKACEELWTLAQEFFESNLGRNWPSDLFTTLRVPPGSGGETYNKLSFFLKDRLSHFNSLHPHAHHSFLWSIGDPVLEVVVLLLQKDIFPKMELIRVDPGRPQSVLHRNMENQIPFQIVARMKDELTESVLQEHLNGVIIASDSMKQAVAKAQRYARCRKPVLILGETGTGKEVLAQIIHNASGCKGKCIALNCGAIPLNLLETELFGSESGGFTDSKSRKGIFEQAHQGTVFLDEFGELHPEHQTKILRVLQEHRLRRVGGDVDIDVDFLLVTATNRDLDAMIAEGKFRRDLYYRINVGKIVLLPLRERPEDVVALARVLINNQVPPKELTEQAYNWLPLQAWPGNFREIQNLFERVEVEFHEKFVIDVEDLISLMDQPRPTETASIAPPKSVDPIYLTYPERKRLEEKQKLIAVLESYNWNLARAAESLGWSSNSLWYRMKKLEIQKKKA